MAQQQVEELGTPSPFPRRPRCNVFWVQDEGEHVPTALEMIRVDLNRGYASSLFFAAGDTLQQLCLDGCRFAGPPSTFLGALVRCKALKTIKLDLYYHFGDCPSAESVGAALTELPQLEDISWHQWTRGQSGFKVVLPTLVEPGNSLKKIVVTDYSDHLPPDFLATRDCDFGNTLRAAASLTELVIVCRVPVRQKDIELVESLIRQTRTLTKLSWQSRFGMAPDNRSYESIADALKSNKSIKDLVLDYKPLMVQPNETDRMEIKAFLSTLDNHNRNLESIDFGSWTRVPVAEDLPEAIRKQMSRIKFLLKLNKSGRAKDLTTTLELLALLAISTDDVSIQFHYLRHNPSLWATVHS